MCTFDRACVCAFARVCVCAFACACACARAQRHLYPKLLVLLSQDVTKRRFWFGRCVVLNVCGGAGRRGCCRDTCGCKNARWKSSCDLGLCTFCSLARPAPHGFSSAVACADCGGAVQSSEPQVIRPPLVSHWPCRTPRPVRVLLFLAWL